MERPEVYKSLSAYRVRNSPPSSSIALLTTTYLKFTPHSNRYPVRISPTTMADEILRLLPKHYRRSFTASDKRILSHAPNVTIVRGALDRLIRRTRIFNRLEGGVPVLPTRRMFQAIRTLVHEIRDGTIMPQTNFENYQNVLNSNYNEVQLDH